MKRSVWLLTAFCCATCVSCKAPRSAKTSFDRDPLVMAHLTHRKDDPMYAETEVDFGGGASGIADDSPVRPASVSQTQAKKPPRGESMADSYAAAPRSRAADYAWLRGTASLVRKDFDEGGPGGWYVVYGRSEKDEYGGKLRLAPSPRLGLLRQGDEVRVTGAVVRGPSGPEYEIESLELGD